MHIKMKVLQIFCIRYIFDRCIIFPAYSSSCDLSVGIFFKKMFCFFYLSTFRNFETVILLFSSLCLEKSNPQDLLKFFCKLFSIHMSISYKHCCACGLYSACGTCFLGGPAVCAGVGVTKAVIFSNLRFLRKFEFF